MGIFILPVEIGDLSHSSLIQDFCPMLSLFLRPHFNRGFGPVRGDPNDMPSHGASFISLSFHIASMARPVPFSARKSATIVIEADPVSSRPGQATLSRHEPASIGRPRQRANLGTHLRAPLSRGGASNERGRQLRRPYSSISRSFCSKAATCSANRFTSSSSVIRRINCRCRRIFISSSTRSPRAR